MFLPNAGEARKMTEPELTEILCDFYSVVKERKPSSEQENNLEGLARAYKEFRIPFWAEVLRTILNTDMDELPSSSG